MILIMWIPLSEMVVGGNLVFVNVLKRNINEDCFFF